MQLLKRIRHFFQPRALVLMYHRIAELKTDPWQLGVSPENFEQHLQILKNTGNVISVKEMVSLLRNKSVSDNSICITFDDGYVDNYLEAKPLLERYQCPATFFIPTSFMGQQQQFWWDDLESILLHYRVLPAKIALNVSNTLFEFDLGTDNVLTNTQVRKHELWAWPATPPSRRCELYLSLWERIRQLPYQELQSVLHAIKSWASFKKPSGKESFPMTLSQLGGLAAHPLIDVGLHTNTHPALSYHSMQVQHAEILVNKESLEKTCGRAIDTIAYPYGNYNNTTLAVVKELNLTAAFTTAEKIVSNLTDPFQVGRLQVRNWNGNDFEKWLSAWRKSPQYL